MTMEMIRRKKRKVSVFDICNVIFFIILSLIFLAPVWYCVVCALTDSETLVRETPFLFPMNFSLEAFKAILLDRSVWVYYRNTILYAFGGTAISLFLTCLMAYPFVIREFKGKAFLNVFMVITMFFSGGMLPSYFLTVALGLKNTIWVMLIPGAVSAYNVIIFRTFFKSIPDSLREAAYVDGAGHYRVFFSIMLPLSKALLATFGLFGIVGKWNDWFTPYLYLTEDTLQPMSLYLRRLLVVAQTFESGGSGADLRNLMENVNSLNLKCAAVLVTIIPVMCVYPFCQKYFAKGIMIGAIKS